MKWFGAWMVILGCGGTGFYLAASWKREEWMLGQLDGILDFLCCELRDKMPPLSDLFRNAAERTERPLKQVLLRFSTELDSQILPDAPRCMEAALAKGPELPEKCRDLLRKLGGSLGRFHLDGQIQSLESCQQECQTLRKDMESRRESCVRGFQTLGLCIGAALAILFL